MTIYGSMTFNEETTYWSFFLAPALAKRQCVETGRTGGVECAPVSGEGGGRNGRLYEHGNNGCLDRHAKFDVTLRARMNLRGESQWSPVLWRVKRAQFVLFPMSPPTKGTLWKISLILWFEVWMSDETGSGSFREMAETCVNYMVIIDTLHCILNACSCFSCRLDSSMSVKPTGPKILASLAHHTDHPKNCCPRRQGTTFWGNASHC